jgi:predicted O-methyltransferase YrrM
MRKEPILELFKKIKPKRLLECGTWLGEGSTRVILDSLKESKISNWKFYTVESNPTHYDIAVKNLENDNVEVIKGFILLDSSGHIGEIEFDYLLSKN